MAADAQPAYAAQAGWQQTSGKWQYIDDSGNYVKGEEKKIDGKWYRFDDQGWMITGWWSGDNEIDTSGTTEIGWQYFNPSGDMVRQCWKKIGSAWYFFDEFGWMLHGGWQYVGIKFSSYEGFSYFEESGALVTNRWVHYRISDELWMYLEESGLPAYGWKKLSGNWYYFCTPEMREESDRQPKGTALVGWWKLDGSWYYFGSSCAMATGWQKIDGTWYYLKGSGAMATGWQKIGGSWYYMNGSGVMQANKWVGNYYVTSSGAMATNTWIGKYHVNENGLWDKTR